MNDRITVRITSEMKDALDRVQREQPPSLGPGRMWFAISWKTGCWVTAICRWRGPARLYLASMRFHWTWFFTWRPKLGHEQNWPRRRPDMS